MDTIQQRTITLNLAREIIHARYPSEAEAFEVYSNVSTNLPGTSGAGRHFTPHEILAQDTLNFIVSVIASIVGNVLYAAGQNYLASRRRPTSTAEAREILCGHAEQVQAIAAAAAQDTPHVETARIIVEELLQSPAENESKSSGETDRASRSDVH